MAHSTCIVSFHSDLPLLQHCEKKRHATTDQLLQYPNFCVGFLLADVIDLLDQGELVVHQGNDFMNERSGPHLLWVSPKHRKGTSTASRPWFGLGIPTSALDAVVSAIAGGNQFTLPPFIYYHKLSGSIPHPLNKLHLGCRQKNKFNATVGGVKYSIPHNCCRSFFHCMAGSTHLNNQSFHSGCVGAMITTDGLHFKIKCSCNSGKSRITGPSLAMHNPTLGMCFTCMRS